MYVSTYLQVAIRQSSSSSANSVFLKMSGSVISGLL